ncbi:SMC-Scp complex subunit ScpB [Sneathia sp. DSM 16631]|uniref:SMC-Scp complex subunit ScpB n=1 Tax=Sneathia TaxID=168808 RepID=UPI001867F930|nr:MULTISPECIES: SMC-Scp complex subunit ScpB [Sneathia]MBE2989339.1 SMC-Scp complex subunit ScpB [Sneathia sp. DSM 16630]MBE3031125.1 SMC-Scp complex subunit ScpB [Sneathia sp. DSM 16631]MDK9581751.1 SMC-Scp complex subunit ScpB [Sneathia vaginalis]
MDLNEIEAIIFLSDKPVPIDELADFLNKTVEETKTLLLDLKEKRENTGINLEIKEEMVKFVTNPNCGKAIQDFFNPTVKVKKLSKSSMETLTIIAFKGPITKSAIEDIKGVSVDGSIQTLLEKKLIYASGRKKSLGNPKLYEVTENFYGYVGIESKEELFNMEKAQWLKEYKEDNIEDK